ncbi:hypothetical protein KKJ06_22440 [Xenorhabdus bovienii]|uniref:hypothetical protein n=1 Tax=Xenorhabdus bovienii TaxID=40576 RepID=UPI0023B2F0FC|nr:hypothetical protein [Xenorhabdus bovienii]MDE9558050.1 hypothetical protein [Xenorhabdus bovienii]MDE9566793.1 hypothetical protein [Xenorhabdus bovienii]
MQSIDKISLPVTMSYLRVVSITLYAASKRALSPLKSFGPGELVAMLRKSQYRQEEGERLSSAEQFYRLSV